MADDEAKEALCDKEEWSMYFLVNQDLKMSRGKVAAQVGHATQDMVEVLMKWHYEGKRRRANRVKGYMAWKAGGARKIILKAPQKVLEGLVEEVDAFPVHDEGRTEVAPDSLTVVGFLPTKEGKLRFGDFHLV